MPPAYQSPKLVPIEKSDQFKDFIDSIDKAIEPLEKELNTNSDLDTATYDKFTAKVEAYNNCKEVAKMFLKKMPIETKVFNA
jgi:hypothetical protein